MSTTRILTLGAVALLLYLAASYAVRAVFPRTEVGYETALAGRISGTFESRHQRSFFLNGHTAPRYDFDAFARVSSVGQQAPADNHLDRYLRKGDFIQKPGNSFVLTVQRGDGITQWTCAPAATP